MDAGARGHVLRVLRDAAESKATGRRLGALRDRAMLTLGWDSALRVSECLALDVEQLIATGHEKRKRPRITQRFELRPDQAKGGIGGTVFVPRAARDALRAYLDAAAEAGWVSRWSGPLFVRTKSAAGASHGRLSKRAAQFAWQRWQQAAGIDSPGYTWHDLRHTAVTRFSAACGGDAYKVAAFARHRDVRTSIRYVHVSDIERAAEDMT